MGEPSAEYLPPDYGVPATTIVEVVTDIVPLSPYWSVICTIPEAVRRPLDTWLRYDADRYWSVVGPNKSRFGHGVAIWPTFTTRAARS